ncbi:MAG: hypothetical protein LBS29_00310 [Endomicrobium sp.]|nr:hypothetical protein [Endomicrobium sp.]
MKSGHKWAFSNEIKQTEGNIQTGEIVALHDSTLNFIGLGL